MTKVARRAAYWALGLLAFANLINYADRNVVTPTYDDLRARFGFSNDELGLLGTVYMVGHAIGTLLFGWFGDRFDRRRVIAYALLAASLACGLGVIATGLGTLAATRFVVGVGTAAVVPVANSLLGELFDGPRKASSLSLFNLGLFIGGVVGFGGGAALGFPFALWVLAALGVAIAIAIRHLHVPARRADDLPLLTWDKFVRQSRELLRLRTMRWILVSTTVMAFAAGGYLAWFLDFLQKDKHMGTLESQILLLAALVGGLAGVIAGGRIADRMLRRRPDGRLVTIVLGMTMTVPTALGCIFLPLGVPMYGVAVATMFFISWYHAPMAASVDDLATDDRAATAQSLVIFLMHLLGTAPASWIVGRLMGPLGRKGAMLVPTGCVAIATVCMVMSLSSFERDRVRGSGAGEPGAL